MTWISLATNGCCIVVPIGHEKGKQTGTEKVPAEYKSGSKIGKTYMKTVPKFDKAPDQMDAGTVFSILSPLFASARITKIAHNAIFDLTGVSKYLGFVPPPPYGDTLIMDWLLDENKFRHGLKYLTEEMYEIKYDSENVGKKVEDFPFGTVAYYSYCDAKFDFLLYKNLIRKIHDEGLSGIYDLEMKVLNVLVGMKLAGARIDVPELNRLREVLRKDLTEKEGAIYRAAGHKFNINSNPQKIEVLFTEQELKPWKKTKGGSFSVDDATLESYPDNKVCVALREYGDISKILSTYVDSWLGTEEEPSLIFDDHIHSDFVQSGTVTGRFSCVSGNTLLPTSRGVFRFDEYIPFEDDYVFTHRENARRVLRKIYKGRDVMYRVSCANGSMIECTRQHKLFTPDGWKSVGRLIPGDKVYIDVSFKELYSGSGEHRPGPEIILRESGETDHISSGANPRNDVSQCPRYPEAELISGNHEAGEPFEVFPVKAERKESDVGENREQASQLQRGNLRRTRIRSGESAREIHPASQAGYVRSSGAGEPSYVDGCSPYRRRSAEQYPRQPGISYQERARETSFQAVEIREITDLGTMGVWDIEVEGDHSYIDTEGFLNHNCRKPNLQNLPRSSTELGKLVRNVFIAEKGHKLIVADYSQIELVVLAHYIGTGKLYEGFLEGIDPHLMTAAMVLGRKPFISNSDGDGGVTRVERQDLGKAQPLSSLVLTPEGFVRMGDIKIGDIVNTPDGGSAKVTGVFPQGKRNVLKVNFSDGTSVRCDEDHLWEVNTRYTKRVLTTKEMMEDDNLIHANGFRKYSVSPIRPVNFLSNGELTVDPYLLGLLLGDGCFRHPDNISITSADEFIVNEVAGRIPEGHSLRCKTKEYGGTGFGVGNKSSDYVIRSGTIGRGNMGLLKKQIIDLGLFGKNSHDKFIPKIYLLSDYCSRLELLRGLMDTDGTAFKDGSLEVYDTVSRKLAEDVCYLVRSLGGIAQVKKRKTNWTYNGVENIGESYRICIWIKENPFKLPRKAEIHDRTFKGIIKKGIVSIEPDGFEETQCIMIDHPKHLYVTDGFTPTHNTLGFAVVYGAGLGKVSSMAHITFDDARRVLKTHAKMFPEIHQFKQDVLDLARSRQPVPYITTLLGRKRRIPDLMSHDDGVRMGAERQTFNSLIQGGAADLMKLAMVRMDAVLPDEAKLILTVHDEVVVTAPEEIADDIADMVREAMTGAGIQKLVRVPLKIELSIGDRWGEVK